jgi:hypothetical protein
MPITGKNITDIQNIIRRGQVAIAANEEGVKKKFKYDGFAEFACPHIHCELHPRRNKIKPCEGFMRWLDQDNQDSMVIEECPWIGGLDFTINETYRVIEWIKINYNPTSKKKSEKIVKVTNL